MPGLRVRPGNFLPFSGCPAGVVSAGTALSAVPVRAGLSAEVCGAEFFARGRGFSMNTMNKSGEQMIDYHRNHENQ